MQMVGVLIYLFVDRLLLCRPNWLQPLHPPAAASQVLGLQKYAMMSELKTVVLSLNLNCSFI